MCRTQRRAARAPQLFHRIRSRRSTVLLRGFTALATALLLFAEEVPAHDPDTYGGVFRTHDAGATWTSINPGAFPSGALALAVNPGDPHHLLLATDSGLWRSRNGGRDWEVDARGILSGPAFAAAFDADGRRALVAGTSSLFRDEADGWRAVRAPSGAAPARALVPGATPGRIYLAGRSGLYRSDDWGESWADAGRGIEADAVDALLAPAGRSDEVCAVAGGAVWWSSDGARTWQRRAGGIPGSRVEAVGLDPAAPARLWAMAAAQVYTSDSPGAEWRAVGKPLPDTAVTARAMAVSGKVIVIATDRGVFRSTDGAERWEPPKESLPAHVAARVLVSDAGNPATLYAGFAVSGYDDLQKQARPSGLRGAADLVLIALIAVAVIAAAARRLAKSR